MNGEPAGSGTNDNCTADGNRDVLSVLSRYAGLCSRYGGLELYKATTPKCFFYDVDMAALYSRCGCFIF